MKAHDHTRSEQPVKVAADALMHELNLGDELPGASLHHADQTPEKVREVTAPGQGRDRPDEMIRHLRLRGGPLDGMTWSGVIDVGKRVCCGTGPWSKDCVYVVTDDTTSGPDGQVESVAVLPAHF